MRISRANDLGLLVRDIRLSKGLSQADLAARASVSRRWLAAFEQGKATVELGLALRTLDALDLAFDVQPRSAVAPNVDLDRILGDPRDQAV